MNPPKHQAMRIASTRRSLDTDVSWDLMTSIAPVCTVMLYTKMAAMITRTMGHSAMTTPSATEVVADRKLACQKTMASTKAMTMAVSAAVQACILMTLIATMSHRMGSNASTK